MEQEILDEVTFEANDPADLPYCEIREALAVHTVARVRGLFDPGVLRRVKERIAERFDPLKDRKHDPRDTEAIRNNFQKLQVGGISMGADRHRSLARFLRMLYNPIFADDIYGMRQHFIRLAEFRNRLYGLSEDFAVRGTENGMWTGARIHQYPTGGGFMVAHRDKYSRAAAESSGHRFFQVFVHLSKKGLDYQEGGAFIEHDDRQIFYERGCEIGDVVIYDGRAMHGVAEIDPMKPLDLHKFSGRIIAFASLYRHLKPGDAYEEMARGARDAYGYK